MAGGEGEISEANSCRGSSMVFEGNSKCHEADMRSPEGIDCTQYTIAKSDVSTEIGLPLSSGSSEMNLMKTHGNHHLIATEDGSQHRTESSCSNSLSVNLPVSLSHWNCDTSKEDYSFRNYVGSMDSSNSKAFDRRSEEPVTTSSESGVSAQIARTAMKNAGARNSFQISSIVGSQSPSLPNKGDGENVPEWGHPIAISDDKQHACTIGKCAVCSGDADKVNRENTPEASIRLCDVHDNRPTSHSGERVMNYKLSVESENRLGHDVMDKIEGGFLKNEFSNSMMIEPCKVAIKDQNTLVAGFDLNEDVNANGMDDCIRPFLASVSSHSVIQVVAKAGRPQGLPIVPLKFEGVLGWKGSAETSAFRAAALSRRADGERSSTNRSSKDPEGFPEIDLNVAATEDSHSEVDSKRTKFLGIDLNRLYNTADEFVQPSLPGESDNHPLFDLNLNVDTSIGDASSNVHGLGQGLLFPKRQKFKVPSHEYLTDTSTMLPVAYNPYPQHYQMAAPNIPGPVRLMERIAPFQPEMPFISHALPPYGYPSRGLFHHSLPHSTYSHPFGTQCLFPVGYGPSSSISTALVSKPVSKTDTSSTSGSKMDEAREFLFLASNSPMGESQHRKISYTPTKRKGPEGGLEYHHPPA